VPPDTHVLSSYARGPGLSIEDYDRPTTPIATFQTDANEPTGVFSFDVTAVLAQFSGRDLGFASTRMRSSGWRRFRRLGVRRALHDPAPHRGDVREPLALTVPLDIKPSSCPEPAQPGSRGALPAALLGTDAVDARDLDRRPSDWPASPPSVRPRRCRPPGNGGALHRFGPMGCRI